MKRIYSFVALVLFLTASLHAQESRLENSTFVFDTSSMLFIEIERHEMRVEIMVKAVPLVSLLSFDTDGEILAIDQQARLKSQALEFFANRFDLSLEGIPTQPSRATADFLNIGDPNSVIKEKAVDEPLADAVLGLSFIFPVEQVPAYFQFAWKEFPESLGQMPAQIRVLDTVQKFALNKYIRTIDWSNVNPDFQLPVILPVPVEDVSWLGRAKLDKQEAVHVVGQLLSNIYHAFEYRDESTIYDQLAVSVDGKQLASIYLEQRERMEAVSRGGPRVKMIDVSMSEVEELEPLGRAFQIKGKWDVSGTVTHFGHTHKRKNRYRAQVTLEPINKQWKISDMVVLEEERIQ